MRERLVWRMCVVVSVGVLGCGSDPGVVDADGGASGIEEELLHCTGEPDERCPCPGATRGSSLYLFCRGTYTWEQARDTCRRYGHELVRIDSAEEHDFVWSTSLAVSGRKDHWTGLHRPAGEWIWSDGTPLGEYRGWGPSLPGEDPESATRNCVELGQLVEGRWNAVSCELGYLDFICEGTIVP